MMASGYEDSQTAVGAILRQLNSAPSVNQFVKSIPEPFPRPAGADWGERYDEAIGLLRSNKVALAAVQIRIAAASCCRSAGDPFRSAHLRHLARRHGCPERSAEEALGVRVAGLRTTLSFPAPCRPWSSPARLPSVFLCWS